jgi:hypothetical protein
MTKYSSIGHRLGALGFEKAEISFAEIEEWLGFPLPRSARVHPAWWANEQSGTHSHARGWLDADYRTSGLNLAATRVTFTRG